MLGFSPGEANHLEPVTHILTGAVLARAGLNRKAAYMTFAMAIAAEFPDIDTAWGAGGPLIGFLHHRGITHTFVALPVEAAILLAGCYAWHRFAKRAPRSPVNWPWLYGGVLLALLSHIFLDWTNNYGVRPFFPFNPRWYAGSFVFVVEPLMLLILAAALVMPALFALINAEVGVKRELFRGRPAAIAALLALSAMWGFRYFEHDVALHLAQQNAPQETTRLFASPHPLDPFTWHVITETPTAYQLSTYNTYTMHYDPPSPRDTLTKPENTLALLVAKRSELGRVYLDWSMYPVLNQAPDTSDPNHPLTAVTFSDARFMYDILWFKGRDEPPLSGTVLLDMEAPEGQRVVETTLDHKLQR